MYTPFRRLLVSPRYLLTFPDGEQAPDGVSLRASLVSLAWLSRGSSGGGVMITKVDLTIFIDYLDNILEIERFRETYGLFHLGLEIVM